MNRRIIVLAGLAGLTMAACGQAPRGNSSWSPPDAPWREAQKAAEAAAATTESGRTPGKGVGPVDHVDIAALDPSMKSVGQEIFKGKCSACHKLSERYVGPALAGVTQRREPEWIMNMVLNPDVMVREDPVAKALLGQYIAPMTNFNLSREEAEGVLLYFLDHDKSLPAAETTSQAGEAEQPPSTMTEGH
jgi:mono/diheme cytochrome c family protein